MTVLTLTTSIQEWPLHEPFEIARGIQTKQRSLLVTLTDQEGRTGRGDAVGIPYKGDTPESVNADIETVREAVENGASREALLSLLPAGGARFGLDSALWDLEAKRTGKSVYNLIGNGPARPVHTACTIGMRSIDAYEQAARSLAAYRFIKVKVSGEGAMEAIAAVHQGAPESQFIIDPNQSWSVDQIENYADDLVKMNVALLEQPIPVGDEASLDGVNVPVKLCADELIDTEADLEKAKGRFDVVNIKLDKSGGLTAGWALADAATAMGFELMVGCMLGSSLSMAPGHVLAQRCAFVDLDGPLLQSKDWDHPLVYNDGLVSPPTSALWG